EGILEKTQTPYFTFHDIDENRPTGSIKIRVETIVYALRQYEMMLKQEVAVTACNLSLKEETLCQVN
ncbi:MAG TPA: hypothetical protein ENK06_04750, partial [Gammaproteobacteria bacterium]|nr:hypothetical protein [Gammaproteobacteria bacterium]